MLGNDISILYTLTIKKNWKENKIVNNVEMVVSWERIADVRLYFRIRDDTFWTA